MLSTDPARRFPSTLGAIESMDARPLPERHPVRDTPRQLVGSADAERSGGDHLMAVHAPAFRRSIRTFSLSWTRDVRFGAVAAGLLGTGAIAAVTWYACGLLSRPMTDEPQRAGVTLENTPPMTTDTAGAFGSAGQGLSLRPAR